MKNLILTFAALTLALPFAGMAQPLAQTTEQQAHYSKQELKKMMQEAHDGPQYQALAGYFHQQESFYRAEAVSEKTEWNRRAQAPGGMSQKMPNATDSARRLYETYSYEADHNGELARHYEQLAAAINTKS